MPNSLQQLLLQIALILLVARLCGFLLKLVGQPRVVGEMVAGLLLGPTVLGRINHGQLLAFLFPDQTRPSLELLSQIGVVLFMFLVGLELDLGKIAHQGKGVLATGLSSMLAPFALGAAFAAWMWSLGFGPTATREISFVLFMAIALSITAFPVLARILTEAKLTRTPLGAVAIACAAMNDLGGWCLLALVLALVKGGQAQSAWQTAAQVAGLAMLYVAVMLFVIRPLILGRIVDRFIWREKVTPDMLGVLFILLTVSALATDYIGIHAIFGAFMLGAVVPAPRGPHGRDSASHHNREKFIHEVTARIEDVATLFLVPLFFAYTGLKTDLALLSDAHAWLMAGGITLVATAGKVGGTMLTARGTGLTFRQQAALGVLMNTRGLMELIILNVGLDVGAIDQRVFSMMVVMTLVTTIATTPIVERLTARE